MKEKTFFSKRKFAGRLLKVDLLEVELGSGRRARREIVRHPGAVAVLCRMRDGRFAFVKQFRKAIESKLLEIVAGTREPNEGKADCARREVREETGYKVRRLAHLGAIFTAPGFCDEQLDVFFAELGTPVNDSRPDPDEDIELVCLDKKQFKKMLASGAIKDSKTLAAWMMYINSAKRRS